jgi:hypothetical protein
MKKEPYNCPCCNYCTQKKSAIIKHLYDLKKPCPKTFNNIELTDSYLNYYKLNNSFGGFFISILLQAYPLTFFQP